MSAFELAACSVGTTQYERRGVADKCAECNHCALIQPFQLRKEESKAALPRYEVRKAQGAGDYDGLHLTVQVEDMECTGPNNALMAAHFEFSMSLPNRNLATSTR